MTSPLTPQRLYESARWFAHTGLQDHHDEKFQRAAISLGIALDHLAKACLASRSPALLAADMKGEASFRSVVALLDLNTQNEPSRQLSRLRTVSLREALNRMEVFIDRDRLRTPYRDVIIDMRDGTIHAAQKDEAELDILAAFIHLANVLLEDLNHELSEFGQNGSTSRNRHARACWRVSLQLRPIKILAIVSPVGAGYAVDLRIHSGRNRAPKAAPALERRSLAHRPPGQAY